MEKVICKCCGEEVFKAKFCPNCGTPLTDENIVDSKEESYAYEDRNIEIINNPIIGNIFEDDNKIPEPIFEPEIKSTMLVDYCRKTLATAMGDGHDEIVLGYVEDKDEYILDEYNKPVGCKESHRMYKTTKQCYIDACKYIEDNKLLSYENNEAFPLCGGDYVVKFRKEDGTYCRLNTGNCPDTGLLIGMGNLLQSHKIIEENKED